MHGCLWPGASGSWRTPWTRAVSLRRMPPISGLTGSGLWMCSPLGELLILQQVPGLTTQQKIIQSLRGLTVYDCDGRLQQGMAGFAGWRACSLAA